MSERKGEGGGGAAKEREWIPSFNYVFDGGEEELKMRGRKSELVV